MSPIAEVTLPPRSRRWTEQDAREAMALLEAGKVAGFGEFTDPTEDDGTPKVGKKSGEPITGDGRARSAGNALNDQIAALNGGKRYRVTVRPIGPGKYMGALEPVEAKHVTRKSGK